MTESGSRPFGSPSATDHAAANSVTEAMIPARTGVGSTSAWLPSAQVNEAPNTHTRSPTRYPTRLRMSQMAVTNQAVLRTPMPSIMPHETPSTFTGTASR